MWSGVCGVRGTCVCSEGWTGWACGRMLGAFGLAVLAKLEGSFVGLQVALSSGWSPAPAVLGNGIGGDGGASLTPTQAMHALIQASVPFPSALPAAGQMRFSKESNSVMVRMGAAVGSGVYYVWHPADDADLHGPLVLLPLSPTLKISKPPLVTLGPEIYRCRCTRLRIIS